MDIKPKPTQKSLIHDLIHWCIFLKRSSSLYGHFDNEKGSTLAWAPSCQVQGLTPPKQPHHLCATDHFLRLSHTAGEEKVRKQSRISRRRIRIQKKKSAIPPPNNQSILMKSLLPPINLWSNVSQQTNTEKRKIKKRKKEQRKKKQQPSKCTSTVTKIISLEIGNAFSKIGNS